MACGVHLGILLICLVQAEHVRCLWASKARRQDGNTNVGFSQQRSGFGGSYLQNQVRPASGSPGSAQSSRLNTDSVGTGSRQRFPSSGYKQTLSQPAKSGYALVGLVQSSSESKPNWRTTKLKQENMQKIPKKMFILSAPIASGSSLNKRDQTLTSKGGAAPRRIPVQTKTSASDSARKVSSRRSSAASKPSRFSSLQNERTTNRPSQSEAWKPYSSKLVPVNARNLPASGTSSTGPSGQGFAPSRIHTIPERFGGYAIRRLEDVDQKEVSVRKPHQPAYAAPQRPSLQQLAYAAPQRPSLQNLAYAAPQRPSLQNLAYAAPQRPSLQQPAYAAPQRPSSQQPAYAAPQRPSLQQPAYAAPQRQSLQQPAYAAPQRQSLQQPAYAAPQRPSLQQPAHVAPKRQSFQRPSYLQQPASAAPHRKSFQRPSYLQQPVSAAPQRPSLQQAVPQRPSLQQPASAAPQRPSLQQAAPQRPSLQQPASAAPQGPSLQQAAPQRPSLQQPASAAPQRPSLQQPAPQRPSAFYKQQVQSVYPEAKWKRVRPSLGQ